MDGKKIWARRYFLYWKPDVIEKILANIGFEIQDIYVKYEGNAQRIYVIARKPVNK